MGRHFDHKIPPRKLASVDSIKTIDADFIRSNYITEAFCKFVYEYSGLVSRTKTEFRDLMFSSDEVSVFDVVGGSDIAWSLTMYVNNKDTWLWKYHEDLRSKKLKAVRDAQALPRLPPPPPPRNTRRNQANQAQQAPAVTDAEEHESPTEDDVPDNPYSKSQPRWTSASQSGKSKYDCGLTTEGKAFYCAMKKALKEVDNTEWEAVWETFWSERKLVDVPSSNKKRKRGAASDVQGDDFFGGGFTMDDLSDVEDDLIPTEL